MPGEVIRASRRQMGQQGGPGQRITVRGRTVRIHLAGILDRAGVQRLIRQAAAALWERDLVVVLDGSQLRHLDYRCVGTLLHWRRNLRGWGHRLVLSGWNGYLRAILAMEDWDGELEGAFPSAATCCVTEPWRHVQAP
jgi:ABC-type transporter Mla MlaB component